MNPDPCFPEQDDLSLISAINWLENELENSDNPNSDLIYTRCLKRNERLLFQKKFESGEYSYVRDYISTPSNNDEVLLFYSSYIFEGSYREAELYLDNIELEESNNELDDFIVVQKIYINAIKNESKKVDSSTLEQVRNLANVDHPYAGYAKALFYWLTSEHLEPNLPNLELRRDSRFNSRTERSKSFKLFPNPFSSELSLEINSTDTYVIKIFDLYGDQVYSGKYSGQLSIDTKYWNAGIYFVNISSGDNLIHQEKMVLIR